jgi:DNA adenine methylase
MRDEIKGASFLLRDRTRLFAEDYKVILRMARERDVIYLDPPYQGVCAQRDSRYLKPIVFDEFINELERLNASGIAYIVSYDGMTGTKKYGRDLPSHLGLHHLRFDAGRSAQATLLGRAETTVESIYLSTGLLERLSLQQKPLESVQLALI